MRRPADVNNNLGRIGLARSSAAGQREAKVAAYPHTLIPTRQSM